MSYQGKYDPAEFNVPPELDKGKSQRIQAYIQSGHDRALTLVARSGVFPFEKESDVIRWCIKYGLEKLDSLEPQLINSVMKRSNIIIDLLREEIERQKFLETLDALRTAVHGHLGRGEEDMAKDVIARVVRQIRAMPDEPERELRWKLKYMEHVEKDFKHYIPY